MDAPPVAEAPADGPLIEDALGLRVRLVDLLFKRAFATPPAGVWHAPSPILLLGGRPGGPALTATTHWRAMVGIRPRQDRALRMLVIEHPEEPLDLSVADLDSPALPPAAALVGRVARAMRRQGLWKGGAELVTYEDAPDGVGLAMAPAMRAAVARALVALSGADIPPAALIAALDEAGGRTPLHAACLLGREGHTALVPAGSGADPGTALQVRFNPARAGVRLVVISLRASAQAPPAGHGERPVSEDAQAGEAFGLLRQAPSEAGPGLGALLSAAHAAACAGREPVEADASVAVAMEAGALGARTITPDAAVAVVPTALVTAVRAAVVRSCRDRTGIRPRFLTTACLAGEPVGGPRRVGAPAAAQEHHDALEGAQ